MPANYTKIEEITQKYNLLDLEDGTQGIGGRINGRKACSFVKAAATSIYPAKPLGCYGDGGAIFTDDDELAATLRSSRADGRAPEDMYYNQTLWLNSRLDTLLAAILLTKLDAFIE